MNDAKPLEHLMILIPTAHGLSWETEQSLDSLCWAGATKLRSDGVSCVALHRCLLAGEAERRLRENERFTTVLWLDGDMVASLLWVRELLELVGQVAECRPLPSGDEPEAQAARDWSDEQARDWRRRNAPALSGAYVKRNRPSVYAARQCNPPVPPLILDLEARTHSRPMHVELPAIVAGMGCLCQTREAFLEHCAESPRIKASDGTSFPGICGAGPGRDLAGAVAWGSEDWTYTSWEWQMGRGVYLVRHAIFGHVGTTIHRPTAATVLDE